MAPACFFFVFLFFFFFVGPFYRDLIVMNQASALSCHNWFADYFRKSSQLWTSSVRFSNLALGGACFPQRSLRNEPGFSSTRGDFLPQRGCWKAALRTVIGSQERRFHSFVSRAIGHKNSEQCLIFPPSKSVTLHRNILRSSHRILNLTVKSNK